MSGQWKPGDVAVNVEHGYRGIYVSGCRNSNHAGGVVPHWHNDSGAWDPSDDIRRPLVVIDPEDAEAVERLARASHDAIHRPGDFDSKTEISREALTSCMQAALREFANPTPPKPDEPQGLGAVVRDAEGRRYVRTADQDCRKPWSYANNYSDHDWDDLHAVEVLSEGVVES